MKAPLYVEILKKALLPFQEHVYPCGMRFMQDNDPKHTSKLKEKGGGADSSSRGTQFSQAEPRRG